MLLMQVCVALVWLATVCRAVPTTGSTQPDPADPDQLLTIFPSWKTGQTLAQVKHVWSGGARWGGMPCMAWEMTETGVEMIVPIGLPYVIFSRRFPAEHDLLLEVELENPSGEPVRLTVKVRKDRPWWEDIHSTSQTVNQTDGRLRLTFPVESRDCVGSRFIELAIEKETSEPNERRWPATLPNALIMTDICMGGDCQRRQGGVRS